MKILYIHGLNGNLSSEKRALLKPYGEVFAPAIHYQSDAHAIETLSTAYKEHDISVVIGSSMGGFIGYYVSNIMQCPALLFNPALAQRSVPQIIPKIHNSTSSFKQIVIGTQDDVVNPIQTLTFISETLIDHPKYKLHIHNNLAHRIPLEVFKEEIQLFFRQLSL